MTLDDHHLAPKKIYFFYKKKNTSFFFFNFLTLQKFIKSIIIKFGKKIENLNY